MASQYLATYAENGHAIAAERIPLVDGGGEANVLQLCTAFRQHGACELLRTGNPRPFFVAAMQSAAAYLHVVRRDAGGTAAVSRAKPFLDAVAGGYWEAARSIADACASWAWKPEVEYREDALYLQTLMAVLRDADDRGALLDEYEEALAGVADDRLPVLRALVAGDAEGFRAAFATLGRARETRIDEAVDRGVLTDETEAWIRPFYLEGAALLRLADRVGIETGRHHPGVPETVRAASPFRFDERAWERVPYVPNPARP